MDWRWGMMCALLAGTVLWSAPGVADTLEVPGTGASEAIMATLAQAFMKHHPQDRIIVPPSVGSSGGVRAVLEKQSPVGRVARALKPDEKRAGLDYLPFAKDAVVFAVGIGVSIRDLSAKQLAEVFSGEIANWRELGGADAPIRVVVRESSDSSLVAIRERLPPFREIELAPSSKMVFHDGEMLGLLEKFPTAIGFLTKSTAQNASVALGVVTIDGVPPGLDQLQSGAYPLALEYALVVRDSEPGSLTQRFIEFVRSPEARRILEDHGLVPIAGP